MDISIDIFVDKDLKKIDEILYVDVNIIPIDFRSQRTLEVRSCKSGCIRAEILRVNFGPKLSKQDISISLRFVVERVEDGRTYATRIFVWVDMCVLPSLYRVFYPSNSVSGMKKKNVLIIVIYDQSKKKTKKHENCWNWWKVEKSHFSKDNQN